MSIEEWATLVLDACDPIWSHCVDQGNIRVIAWGHERGRASNGPEARVAAAKALLNEDYYREKVVNLGIETDFRKLFSA